MSTDTDHIATWRFIRARCEPGRNGCWLWTGATTNGGYAKITVTGNRGILVHRLARAI